MNLCRTCCWVLGLGHPPAIDNGLVGLNRLNQRALNSEGYQPGRMVPACHKHVWNEVRIAMSVASLGYRERQQMQIKK